MQALRRTATFLITQFSELATLINAIDAAGDHLDHATSPEIRRELNQAAATLADTRCGAFVANGCALELTATAVNVLDDVLDVWAQGFEGDAYSTGAPLEEAREVWRNVEELRTALKASGMLEASGAPTCDQSAKAVLP